MAEVVLNHVKKKFGGSLAVKDMDIRIEKGELVSFLGPSGCGKSTTLRMVAGFLQPDEGKIFIGGKDVTRIPANKRDTALVFQNYALFPHMTIFDNVAFGLKMRKLSKDEIRTRVNEALEMVHLENYSERYPRQLSGGQQQRVALARAIVVKPRLLLLDEPLSNLDAKLRIAMRNQIRELQQKLDLTAIFVTHDQEEALVLSDRIVVLEQGSIRQIGSPQEVFDTPKTHFVADFVGIRNFFDGYFENNRFITKSGLTIITNSTDNQDSKMIGIRSNMIVINPNNPDLYENKAMVKVQSIIYRGTSVEITAAFSTGETIEIEMPSEQFKLNTIALDDDVLVYWKADNVLPLTE
jgi:putative spermidine/putrescine transport system ATP-binding protein